MIRLGILGSTRGTNLAALIEAIRTRQLDAAIHLVASNKPDAMILERAKENGLPAQFIDAAGLERDAYDQKVSDAFIAANVDLIVLIGYMRIISADFIHHWQHRIINIHPSLLPDFAGLMDLAVHQAVLDAGVLETGCTVHYVTKEVDAGPIVIQKKCRVLKTDTALLLKARVQQMEGAALVEAILRINQYPHDWQGS